MGRNTRRTTWGLYRYWQHKGVGILQRNVSDLWLQQIGWSVPLGADHRLFDRQHDTTARGVWRWEPHCDSHCLSVCSLFFCTGAYSKLCFALLSTYADSTCSTSPAYRAAKCKSFLLECNGLPCWVTGWTHVDWAVTTVGMLGNGNIVIIIIN